MFSPTKALLPTLAGLIALSACTAGPAVSPTPSVAPTPAPAPTPALWQEAIPIGEILADPEAYRGKRVVVVGYYRGWDLLDEADAPPPVTRSDVVVADATGGIYFVSGPNARWSGAEVKLPPHSLEATEQLLRLEGVVKISEMGNPYLEVTQGGPAEGLPTGVLIRVRRTGTIAGLNEELMAMDDGLVYVLDRKTRKHTRFTLAASEVKAVAEKLSGLAGQGELGEPVPDTLTYRITFWDGESFHTVLWHDHGLPDAAAEVLRELDAWFTRTKG